MNKEKLIFQTTELLTQDEKLQIMELWNCEYPINLMHTDLASFEKYLDSLESPKHFLIKIQERIVGWGTIFKRDQEKWFAIILSSFFHGQYIGKSLMEQIKRDENLLYGWVIDHEKDIKINGMTYRSPLNFYVKQGFTVLFDERLELSTISAVKIVWER
ncbi:GNAT family N-acetyltransferase [Sphingobacterium lactis]|uniref:GNAT family N-acetyltransferase n=1 Tax=Sphingobacterium lactis TaxID=797291 RepID=UPI003F7FB7A9